MTRLEEFYIDLLQTIASSADSRGLMMPQAFFERAAEDLAYFGDLSPDYAAAEYRKADAEAFGYDYEEGTGTLTLLTCIFFQEHKMQVLKKPQILSAFAKLETFFLSCAAGLYSKLEETADAYDMAYNIYRYSKQGKIERIRLLLISDGKLQKTGEHQPKGSINGIPVDSRIVDIEYLQNIYLSQAAAEPFEVKTNLPFLKAADGQEYQSYLTVISGDQLADIYEEHREKILEQNVRTFLQFKGNVNKGLKNTIEQHPERFFAYNNGITAVASAVEFNDAGRIIKIKNFQVVNGGQTVSAIYAAFKKSALAVAAISVQMKLSVVTNKAFHDEFVSRVAEYANTQNKINDSDFFSNHPFHRELKVLSQDVFAPITGQSQRRTRWYYERVRGEYLNNQAYLSKEDKRKYHLDYPKEQFFDKTLLSKTENVWRCIPHIVSKGAQGSFKAYAEFIIRQLDQDPGYVNAAFFKSAVARILLFRNTEKLITKSPWYDGGYRAQTAAYTIAKLSDFLSEAGIQLYFSVIWDLQAIPQPLIRLLEEISKKVYDTITNPAQGKANPAQYAKTPGCWEAVQKVHITFTDWDPVLFGGSNSPEPKPAAAEAPDAKKFVAKKQPRDWMLLLDSYDDDSSKKALTPRQRGILTKMAHGQITEPSDADCQLLYELHAAVM